MDLTYNNVTKPLLYLDIEVYPNYWLIYAIDDEDKEYIIDSLFAYTDIRNTIEYIVSNYYVVGYNNFAYDDKVLSAIYKTPTTDIIYALSQDLINSTGYVKRYILHNLISFDLYKDIPMTSLKTIMCNMGLNIEETPTNFNKDINLDRDPNKILHYCKNDVLATRTLTPKLRDNLNLRIFLCQQLGYFSRTTLSNLTNKVYGKAPKLASIQVPDLEISEPLYSHFRSLHGAKEPTELKINVFDNECIFGSGGLHGINPAYTNKKLNKVMALDYASLYPHIIKELNLLGNNTDKYVNLLTTRIAIKGIIAELYKDDVKEVVNKHYKLIKPQIQDLVEAYKNNNFDMETFKTKLISRLIDVQTNQKLTLNKLFGTLGSEYMENADVYKLLTVCVTGQLYCVYLTESILAHLNCDIIQINTDGVYFTSTDDNVQQVIDDVYKATNIKVELEYFDFMFQKDVNNYFTVNNDGKIKAKGAQVKNFKSNALTSNNDYGIIDLMIINKLAFDKDFTQTITEVRDPIYYQKVCKITKAFAYITDSKGKKYQHVNRVFASKHPNSTSTLYKVKVNEDNKVTKQAKVTNCPDRLIIHNGSLEGVTLEDLNIDYNFYIEMANKRLKNWLGV